MGGAGWETMTKTPKRAEKPGRQKSTGKKKKVNLPSALQKGYDLLRAGRMDKAEPIFNKILKAQPDTAPAHNLLGMVKANKGDMDQALACYRRAIEFDPNLADAHNNLGNLLRHRKSWDEAEACYRQVVGLSPASAVARRNLGKVLDGQGRTDEAMACYREALDIDPNDTDSLNRLGIGFRTRKEPDKAEENFRRSIDIDPNFVPAYINLGNTLREKGRFHEAITHLKQALTIEPGHAEAHNGLGITYKDQGQPEQAAACYRRAVAIAPDHAEAHNNLANVLADLGQFENAAAEFEKAMELRPNFMEAEANYALHRTFEPGDENLERLKAYLDEDTLTDDQRNHLYFILGEVHKKMGLYEEAFSYYRLGSEEKDRQENFDNTRHRKGIAQIIGVFGERPELPDTGRAIADPAPIIVLGMSRSGKTLVESILSRHEDVFPGGELYYFTDALKEVTDEKKFPEHFPLYMDRLKEADIRQIGDIYLERLSELAPEARYVVDTMPSNYPYVGLMFRAIPKLKMIFCGRNLMDNCLFSYFHRYKTGNGYSYDLKKTATYYADYHVLLDHWRRMFGDRILSIHYENLVHDPARVTEDIFAFCGLPFDPSMAPDDITTDEVNYWVKFEPCLQDFLEWMKASAK